MGLVVWGCLFVRMTTQDLGKFIADSMISKQTKTTIHKVLFFFVFCRLITPLGICKALKFSIEFFGVSFWFREFVWLLLQAREILGGLNLCPHSLWVLRKESQYFYPNRCCLGWT